MKPSLLVCLLLLHGASSAAQTPRFEMQEITRDLSIGYAVIAADINGDGKPDLVVVDKHRVIWFENPTWKMHTILTGKTRPDNVCIAAWDVDGDGKIDLILGADWAPFNTKSGGTLHWLKQPKNLNQEWEMFPICEEPTVHRVKVIPNLYPGHKPGIVLAPLMGRDSSREANWMDGRPVRLLSFPIPKDPQKGPWKADVISEELHVVHNFAFEEVAPNSLRIATASYEGVSLFTRTTKDGSWVKRNFNPGNQANLKSNRGSSEIALFLLKGGDGANRDGRGKAIIATIEPWHGNQVVVYPPTASSATQIENSTKNRLILDDHLRWGHAVKFGHLLGADSPFLVAGVRDNPNKEDKFSEKCGVRIYQPEDAAATKWRRTILDEGGIAVEDLIVADLDGDGRPEIIAVGRATKNMRIYWNKTGK
ncbi:VCBS repeat-containing protein [Telmatocola sphagniphila]|uniref:VCBS repeat-containing protein n=1 Tax=Telmatocola sphagniphila TaxID=1123043 RepID=A0A8E6B864_9BACT|nr:VCBS repeat-containing protein [Telmatocola sphagniphila]QVL33269.1 VCBS repeat-containing protein [Telmatocola sphagniphila]